MSGAILPFPQYAFMAWWFCLFYTSAYTVTHCVPIRPFTQQTFLADFSSKSIGLFSGQRFCLNVEFKWLNLVFRILEIPVKNIVPEIGYLVLKSFVVSLSHSKKILE
jgi:hypothetical protein